MREHAYGYPISETRVVELLALFGGRAAMQIAPNRGVMCTALSNGRCSLIVGHVGPHVGLGSDLGFGRPVYYIWTDEP